MDHEARQRLLQQLEALVFSGVSPLDKDGVAEVKKLCRSSDELIQCAYDQLLEYLEYDHAQVRLAAVELVGILFSRAAVFRGLLSRDLRYFLRLTLDTENDDPLPPPKQHARLLRSTTLELIKRWHAKYGADIKQLDLAYHYLKSKIKVNFDDIAAELGDEAVARRQREMQQAHSSQERLRSLLEEVSAQRPELDTVLAEIESLLELLVPLPGEAAFAARDDSEAVTSVADATMRGVDLLDELDANIEEEEEDSDDTDEDEDEVVALRTRSGKSVPPSPAGASPPAKGKRVGKRAGDAGSKAGSKAPRVGKRMGKAAKGTLASSKSASETHNGSEEAGLGMQIGDSQSGKGVSAETVRVNNAGSSPQAQPASDDAPVQINIAKLTGPIKIKETEQNAIMIAKLLENGRLLQSKYDHLVESWLQTAHRSYARDRDVHMLIDLKGRVRDAVARFERVDIAPLSVHEKSVLPANHSATAMDDDDDDEFSDVPLLVNPAKDSARSSATAVERRNEAPPRGGLSGPTSQPMPSDSFRRRAESPTTRRRRLLKQSGHKICDESVATMHVGGQRVFTDRLRVSLPPGGSIFAVKREEDRAAAAAAAAAAATTRVASSAAAAAVSNSAASGAEESKSALANAASRRERLLAKAPVVSYGPDLMFWGAREKKSTAVVDVDNWWQTAPESNEDGDKADFATLPKRRVFLGASRDGGARQCLAPVEGKVHEDGRPVLCKYTAKTRCIHHGLIVPRNLETGKVLRQADKELLAQEAAEGKKDAKDGKRRRNKREVNLVPVKRSKPLMKLINSAKSAPVSLIDPTLDRLRREKFSDNWVK